MYLLLQPLLRGAALHFSAHLDQVRTPPHVLLQCDIAARFGRPRNVVVCLVITID